MRTLPFTKHCYTRFCERAKHIADIPRQDIWYSLYKIISECNTCVPLTKFSYNSIYAHSAAHEITFVFIRDGNSDSFIAITCLSEAPITLDEVDDVFADFNDPEFRAEYNKHRESIFYSPLGVAMRERRIEKIVKKKKKSKRSLNNLLASKRGKSNRKLGQNGTPHFPLFDDPI